MCAAVDIEARCGEFLKVLNFFKGFVLILNFIFHDFKFLKVFSKNKSTVLFSNLSLIQPTLDYQQKHTSTQKKR
jgi:hypothetical protein